MPPRHDPLAIAALVTGAVVWGLIWYPYRVLEQAGMSGVVAAVLTYFVALALGLALLRRHWRRARAGWGLALIGLAAGGCNLGYVLGTLDGVVMRVLLLFYLAPLWTVVLARLLLAERVNRAGALVIGLSLAGAVAMLWHPELGLPFPAEAAEWIGLGSGFLFALGNVLVRRTRHLSIQVKALAVFLGVVVVGLALLPLRAEPAFGPNPDWLLLGTLVVLVGVVLYAVNLVVQYGLMRTSANQAIVIFLFELVVAAASSWWLAGEQMGAREWAGGAMIVAASLFSGRLSHES